jgi:RimJ/RimL family protein N-acetyltransferase
VRYAARRIDQVQTVTSAIRIRPIEFGDVPSFREYVDAVARERRYFMILEAFPLDKTAEFVARNITTGNLQFVAVDGATVVGAVDLHPHKFEGFRHNASLGIGLIAGYRGRGLGARLLETAIAAATENGFRRLELVVYANNAAAIRIYKKFGFAEEGVFRGQRELDGVREDVIAMVKFLE